jgi:HlyD family type I secretion membrane fusion protein
MKITEKKQAGFSPAPYMLAGYAVIALGLGVFGTWAATAPLASGVVAGGVVDVFGNKKIIQHLEGGIINSIRVHEGDVVKAGDVLVTLDPTQARGNYAVLLSRLTHLRATEVRLQAEAGEAEKLVFPDDLKRLAIDPNLIVREGELDFFRVQQTLFRDRQATKEGQINILKARIDQLDEELLGLEAQRASLTDRQASLTAEIERLSKGQKGGFVATNQVAEITRTNMELSGNLGQITANIAKAKQSVAENELQILQINQEFVERASTELREVGDQINEAAERLRQARDVLERTTVRAPVSGMVQNIQIHTTSGVIRPAEPIMEIVPLDDNLVVNARIRPMDIDSVSVGSTAEVRFPAFASRTTPVIFGTVQVVSQDIITPPDSRIEPYYSVRIRVADKDIPDNIRGRLVPGMPVEAILVSGERTMVQYLLKPLRDQLAKGLLEE